jgi:hypothetical protein
MSKQTPGGKIGAFAVLMLLAALSAGLFGAVHNQLSYSVGPGYFTDFKFVQFGTPPDLSPRAGAALVGWQASWWMGLIAGLPVLGYGLMRAPTTGALWAGGIGAIITVIMTAAICALLGLGAGFAYVATGLDLLTPPANVPAAEYFRAGFMHDASYLGGILGTLFAFFPMARATRLPTAGTPT